MRKRETSKVLVASILIYCGVLGALVVVGWVINDLNDAAGVLAALFVPVGIALGFYFWKAKNENVIKFGKHMTKEDLSDTLKSTLKGEE